MREYLDPLSKSQNVVDFAIAATSPATYKQCSNVFKTLGENNEERIATSVQKMSFALDERLI